MRQRYRLVALTALYIATSAVPAANPPPSTAGGAAPSQMEEKPQQVSELRFSGNFTDGSPAIITARYERHKDYAWMKGDIAHGPFSYVFEAKIIGQAGMGQLIDRSHNRQHAIRIEATEIGIALTLDPLQAGAAKTYFFRKL